MKTPLSALLLGCLLMAAPRVEAKDPATDLKQVETLYAAGEYEGAARGVNELLIKDQELPAEIRARAFLMKARIEMAYGQASESRVWLAKAYEVNPSLTLDPVKDPPQLHAIWGQVKGGSKGPATQATNAQDDRLRYIMSYMPFGVAQTKNGHYERALLIGVGQTILAAVGATSEGVEQRRVAATLFFASWGYSIYDGVKYHQDKTVAWQVLPTERHGRAGALLITTLTLSP